MFVFLTLWDTRGMRETHEPVAINVDLIAHMRVSGNNPYATRVFFKTALATFPEGYVNVLETLPEIAAQIIGGNWEPMAKGRPDGQ